MLFLKIILLGSLGFILYQDVKERQVYWFLFPIIALCTGILFYNNTISELFISASLLNLIFVTVLLIAVYLYSRFKLKTKFNHVFGLGDVLFFFAVCSSFSTISFIVIFSCSLFFSLILHLFLSQNKKSLTVPLAGYMSLFFSFIYLGFWTGLIQSVYQI